MKLIRALIPIAMSLCMVGCNNAGKSSPVKSMEVLFPTRNNYTETYNFRYDSEGRLTLVERCTVAEGSKHTTSWKYSYDSQSLKAAAEVKAWNKTRRAEVLFQDDLSHMVSFTIGEEPDADPATGIAFLGQTWEGSYTDGRLARSLFADFTSDGVDAGKLTWESDLLLKYEGSDPSVFEEIKDIEYNDTPNPFDKVDPAIYLLGIGNFFWQGLAGPRPASLIGAYTHVASDPWVEDISMDHVVLAYETAPGGRITRIVQTVNGQTEKIVTISY
ncbi:MAG: hypothetical protein J6X77_01315 [Bacteroidales bacterium]|nr:hypothetical protein [Bacteroidales bacterium]